MIIDHIGIAVKDIQKAISYWERVFKYKQATDETLLDFSRFLVVAVTAKFVKKDFREFDYLTIQPTTFAIILTYILVFIVSIVSSWWAVRNQIDESNRPSYRARRWR